jgi:hypothetical protein
MAAQVITGVVRSEEVLFGVDAGARIQDKGFGIADE